MASCAEFTAPPGAPPIAGFMRTCGKDAELLDYALRSICRFATPWLSSGLTVTYAPHEAALLAPHLQRYPWLHARASDLPRCRARQS